jgi:uncharacterized damage-inducible protein DinB
MAWRWCSPAGGTSGIEALLNRQKVHMAAEQSQLTRAFLDFSRLKLAKEFWPRLRTCVESLTEDQVWWRPNEASNSIGNLLLHLNGNVRQWLLVSFNHAEDTRDRPAEFAERSRLAPSALLQQLGATVDEACGVITRLTHDQLVTPMQIQGYSVTGLQAVYHVVEHFGIHYGQIAYITKLVREADLGFYRELDRVGKP